MEAWSNNQLEKEFDELERQEKTQLCEETLKEIEERKEKITSILFQRYIENEEDEWIDDVGQL